MSSIIGTVFEYYTTSFLSKALVNSKVVFKFCDTLSDYNWIEIQNVLVPITFSVVLESNGIKFLRSHKRKIFLNIINY